MGRLSTLAPQLPTPPILHYTSTQPPPPSLGSCMELTELPLLTGTLSCSQPWAHPAPPPAARLANPQMLNGLSGNGQRGWAVSQWGGAVPTHIPLS